MAISQDFLKDLLKYSLQVTFVILWFIYLWQYLLAKQQVEILSSQVEELISINTQCLDTASQCGSALSLCVDTLDHRVNTENTNIQLTSQQD